MMIEEIEDDVDLLTYGAESGDYYDDNNAAQLAEAAAIKLQQGTHRHQGGGRQGARHGDVGGNHWDLNQGNNSNPNNRNSDGNGGGGFRQTDLKVGGGGLYPSVDDDIEEDISGGGGAGGTASGRSPGPKLLNQGRGGDDRGAGVVGSRAPRHERQVSQASSGGGGMIGTYQGSIGTFASGTGGGASSSAHELKMRIIEIRLHSGVGVALRVVAPIGKGDDGDIHLAIRTNTTNNNLECGDGDGGASPASLNPLSAGFGTTGPSSARGSASTSAGSSPGTTNNNSQPSAAVLPPDVFGVKVLPVFDGMDAEFTQSFGASASNTLDAVRLYRKEIMALTKLHHRNVLRYHGTAKEAEWLYVVMQYCTGGSLSSLVREFGALPEPLVILFTAQLLDALTYLHSNNVCHRNMTLENLLLDVDDTIGTLQVIIGDFGNSVHRHLFAHRRRTSSYTDDRSTPRAFEVSAGYPAEDDGLVGMGGSRSTTTTTTTGMVGPLSPLAPLHDMMIEEDNFEDPLTPTSPLSATDSPLKYQSTCSIGSADTPTNHLSLSNAPPSIGLGGGSLVPPGATATNLPARSPRKAWGVGAGPAGSAATSSTKSYHMDLWCCGCCVIEMLSGVPLPSRCRDEQNAEEPVLPENVVQQLRSTGSLAYVRSFLAACFSLDREHASAAELAEHRWVQKSTHGDIMKEALEGGYYRQLEGKVAERGAAMRQVAEEELLSAAKVDPSRLKIVRDHGVAGGVCGGARRSPFRRLENPGGGDERQGGATGAVPLLSGRSLHPKPSVGGGGGVPSQPTPRRVVVHIS